VNRAWKENRRSSGEGYLLSRGQAVRQNTHEGRTKRSRGTPKKRGSGERILRFGRIGDPHTAAAAGQSIGGGV